MAIARLIYRIGHPVLRAKAQEVGRFDQNLEQLIDDMWETMRLARGTGLSAPQIGLSIRVLVAKDSEREVALINPEIIEASQEELLDEEGCLSIPGFIGLNIRRAASVKVKGYDTNGKEVLIQAEGWLARVLQHEIDHLDGILYIDRLDSPKDLAFTVPDEIEKVMAAKVEAYQQAAMDENGEAETVTKSEKGSSQKNGARKSKLAGDTKSKSKTTKGTNTVQSNKSRKKVPGTSTKSSANHPVKSNNPATVKTR